MPGIPINPIIWFLREKVGKLTFIQTRPKSSGNLPIVTKNVNMPWHGVRPDLNGLNQVSKTIPNVVHELLPKPTTVLRITGVTKDSTGSALGSCVVHLFRTIDDAIMEVQTSNASTGAFSMSCIGGAELYYLVAYKPGGTDVAGTTINTLVGNA